MLSIINNVLPIIIALGFLALCCVGIRKADQAYLAQTRSINHEENRIFPMQKVFGWFGLVWSLFYALLMIFSLFSTHGVIRDILKCCVCELPFILVGIFCILYGCNRKFEITDQEIRYTNALRKTKVYPLHTITSIKESFFGHYVCFIHGKRAFVINGWLTVLLSTIEKNALELGNNINVVTKKAEMERKLDNKVIVSKTNIFGYLPILGIIVLPLGLLSYGVGLVLPLIFWTVGVILFLQLLLYKVIFDCEQRKLKKRSYFVTKEYMIDDYQREPARNRCTGKTMAVVFFKNGKRQFSVDTSFAVTNADILCDALK